MLDDEVDRRHELWSSGNACGRIDNPMPKWTTAFKNGYRLANALELAGLNLTVHLPETADRMAVGVGDFVIVILENAIDGERLRVQVIKPCAMTDFVVESITTLIFHTD